MVAHEFTLIMEGPDLQDEAVIDALFEAGLDDATVGRVGTLQYVDVDRESEQFAEAVSSAIEAIERRCPRQSKPSRGCLLCSSGARRA